MKIQQKNANVAKCANYAKFQKFQLDNLVDFDKCCKTRIFLQKSVPIQPKTSNLLPKFCQKLATTLRVRRADDAVHKSARAIAGPAPGRPAGSERRRGRTERRRPRPPRPPKKGGAFSKNAFSKNAFSKNAFISS